MEIDRRRLTDTIKKHLSYDGDGGRTCPHCGKYTVQPRTWLDHKSTLASRIVHDGLPEMPRRLKGDLVEALTEEVLEDVYVTGRDAEDAKEIAQAVIEWLGEAA